MPPTAKKKPQPSSPASRAKAGTPAKPAKPENKLAKLGLHNDMDLVLHLPLRYEDETTLMSIAEASLRGLQTVQVEGVVTACDVQFRPRRQLIVTVGDDSGQLTLRFINFYGSQTKQLAEGTRVRVRGELRHGFFGAEMVHPSYKVVNEGAPLPDVLTPVYPAGEGLSQAYLRKAIANAMSRLDWSDTLPPSMLQTLDLAAFEPSVRLLHNPPPDVDEYALTEKSHPAWIRMKFDELLAQQLSLKRAQAARRAKTARALPVTGRLTEELTKVLPFQLTGAQQRVQIAVDPVGVLGDVLQQRDAAGIVQRWASPAADGHRQQRQVPTDHGAGGPPTDQGQCVIGEQRACGDAFGHRRP